MNRPFFIVPRLFHLLYNQAVYCDEHLASVSGLPISVQSLYIEVANIIFTI